MFGRNEIRRLNSEVRYLNSMVAELKRQIYVLENALAESNSQCNDLAQIIKNLTSTPQTSQPLLTNEERQYLLGGNSDA